MKPLHRLPRSLLLFSFFFLLLTTSCFPAAAAITNTSTDPKPLANYVFVTPNAQPTSTPFQPMQETPLPNLPVVPTLTEPSVPPTRRVEPVETTAPQPTDIPTVQPTNAPANTAIPPAPPPASVNKPQYAISVMMDYAGHIVTVSEAVVYPNRSSDAMSSIAFAVNPNLWNGVFALQTLSINDQATSNYSLAGQWLIVNLDASLQPGQAVKIGIGYQLNLPYSSSKFENFGYTGRQTNLIDWYPFVPPYRAGNWILPDPYAYGENLVYEKADFRVSLSFADPANAPVVAASAPASLENGVLVYSLPNARNFTISASPEYLFSTADANGVTIYNYYYPEDATAAANVLELTRLAVNTYSTEFGPYPHGTLTVCETDLNDGLETDGVYFLARSFYRAYDGTVRNNLSVIAVHETAHQWWYGAVANNQATEPWLDEAMCTYSEHVFFEDNYPDLLNWWWNFRVYYYGASGYVDNRVYDTASFRAYVNAVYFNGARFIQSLRDRIGDDAFFAFIRDYYARYNGSIATADDFFAVLDLHTSADYSDLVTNFFRYR
jgi:hypothetical protein